MTALPQAEEAPRARSGAEPGPGHAERDATTHFRHPSVVVWRGRVAARRAIVVAVTSVITATWRALGSPKRALALALLLVGLVSAEWLATQSGAALAIDVGLFLAFCVFAPAGYRVLAPRSGGIGVGHGLYMLLCAGIVFGTGALVRLGLGLAWTYVVESFVAGDPLGAVLGRRLGAGP